MKTCDELVIEPRGQECVQRLETVGIVLRGRRWCGFLEGIFFESWSISREIWGHLKRRWRGLFLNFKLSIVFFICHVHIMLHITFKVFLCTLNSLINKQTRISEYGGKIYLFVTWKMRVWWNFFYIYMKSWKYGGKKSKRTKQACSFIRDFRVWRNCLFLKASLI